MKYKVTKQSRMSGQAHGSRGWTLWAAFGGVLVAVAILSTLVQAVAGVELGSWM